MDEKLFLQHLLMLPSHYTEAETSRLSIIYFCVAGLDILGNLENEVDKQWIIDHLYDHQVTTDIKNLTHNGGFIGSKYLGKKEGEGENTRSLEPGHLAMSYSALASLLTLGDDLSRVNKENLIQSKPYI
jgi:geranylgeranyl transferase type-1 subunit beta